MDSIRIVPRDVAKRELCQPVGRCTRWAACGALLLAATLGMAQEQPLQRSVEQPQASTGNAPAVVLTTVHGVVRNSASGEPLARALVQIEGDADTGTMTDNQGRFELPGVPIGQQTIRVRKPGFQDRPYATEDVGYQGEGPAHNVLVAAAMPDLDFALSPTSVIRGRVELSTGEPGQGIALTLLKQVVRNGRAVWTMNKVTPTNGSGAYRFAGLTAGVYALYTNPALESEQAVSTVAAGAKVAREGYPSIFYPAARELSDAARIRLKDGEQAEANMLLTLEPFYVVAATAIMPTGKPFEGIRTSDGQASSSVQSFSVLDASGRRLAYTGQFDQKTGTFQVSLPDGTYSLLWSVTTSEPRVSNTGDGPGTTMRSLERLSGFADVSVDGHEVTNLRIALGPEGSSPIHVRVVRTAAQSNANSNLKPRDLITVTASDAGYAPMGEGIVDPFIESSGADSLELNGASSGHLWLSVQVNDRSLCLDSFNAGGVNLAREPLNVPLGASSPPMELILRDDCAKLTLSLPTMLSAFLPGDEPFYTVYVVPDFDTTLDIPPMNMHPSSGATLTVDGLTPGNYHVYVFDRPVRLEYRNPEVIAALPTPGQAVTLTSGATSNLVLEVPER